MKIKPDCLDKSTMVEINRRFEDGTFRDEASLDFIIYEVGKTRGTNRKAATLISGITLKHPFVDGNKRTAVECMKLFLINRGKRITSKDDTLFDLIHRIHDGRYDIDKTSEWIFNHTVRVEE